jgi:hypothetical protein
MPVELNAQFQAIKPKRLRCAVMPLFCLCAEDVEKLSSDLAHRALADLLAAWKKRDHRLMGSFWLIDHKLIKDELPRPPAILKDATRELVKLSVRMLGLGPSLADDDLP